MTSNDPILWVKAAASSASGNCVEMRRHDAAVEVRDTKDHGHGPTLRVSPTLFAAWIADAKNGKYDQLR